MRSFTLLVSCIISFGFFTLSLAPGALPKESIPVQKYYTLDEGILHSQIVDKPIGSQNPLMLADLDGDGRRECLALIESQAVLYSSPCAAESAILWRSPEAWQVKQAELTDLNRDGALEITLLAWRAFQPWPVDRLYNHTSRIAGFHDDAGQSCHLILIGWQEGDPGEYREAWAGSAMVDPLLAFVAADLDGDGSQELAALETRYNDPSGTPAWSLSAWAWNGFGFTLAARKEGNYSDLQSSQMINGKQILIVNEQEER